MRPAVIAVERHFELVGGFVVIEAGVMMQAGKEPSAEQRVEARVGISSRDIDAVVNLPIGLPFHRDPMRRVFRRHAEHFRHMRWTDVLEADEANTGDAETIHQVRPKWGRKLPRENDGINPPIGENAPVDHAVYGRYLHHAASSVPTLLFIKRQLAHPARGFGGAYPSTLSYTRT